MERRLIEKMAGLKRGGKRALRELHEEFVAERADEKSKAEAHFNRVTEFTEMIQLIEDVTRNDSETPTDHETQF